MLHDRYSLAQGELLRSEEEKEEEDCSLPVSINCYRIRKGGRTEAAALICICFSALNVKDEDKTSLVWMNWADPPPEKRHNYRLYCVVLQFSWLDNTPWAASAVNEWATLEMRSGTAIATCQWMGWEMRLHSGCKIKWPMACKSR